jgi:hypothetical protein
MLSSVLNSERAVQVNIEIMRAFVRLRETASTHKDMAGKLNALESRYDRQYKVVFYAIRGLMKEPEPQTTVSLRSLAWPHIPLEFTR